MAARQARTKCNRRPPSFNPVDPSFAGLTQFRARSDASQLYVDFAAHATGKGPQSPRFEYRAGGISARNSIDYRAAPAHLRGAAGKRGHPLDHQHDLADMRAAFHFGMRGAGLRKREGAVDHRSDSGRSNERQDVLLHAARD